MVVVQENDWVWLLLPGEFQDRFYLRLTLEYLDDEFVKNNKYCANQNTVKIRNK